MKTYQGSCHCDGVRFSFTGAEILRGLRCNCSICRRKGAMMTDFFIAPADLVIETKDNCLAAYKFGSHVATHFFCRVCGIYPFHQTLRKPGHYRINIGCVEGVDSLALPCEVFDGASL